MVMLPPETTSVGVKSILEVGAVLVTFSVQLYPPEQLRAPLVEVKVRLALPEAWIIFIPPPIVNKKRNAVIHAAAKNNTNIRRFPLNRSAG